MEIHILHVTDCPNVDRVRLRLAEAIAVVGAVADVRATVVTTDAEARRLGMRGSPTMLVDGVDPFDADDDVGLSCRLYRDGEVLTGAPSVGALVEALTARRRGA